MRVVRHAGGTTTAPRSVRPLRSWSLPVPSLGIPAPPVAFEATHAADVALRRSALGAAGVLALVYGLAGFHHPTDAVPFLVLLAGLALGTGRARLLGAAWPILCWPMLYDGAVRVVELQAYRSVDHWLATMDRFLTLGAAPGCFELGGPVEELANAFYTSYWVVVPLGAVLAWRKLGEAGLRQYSTGVLGAFVACALVWLALPAGGWHPTGSPTTAPFGPFTAIAREVYALHPHAAAAFPSSHAALAFAAAGGLVALGGSRWWWVWACGVAWATFQGQYHYLVDAPPGILIGILAADRAATVARNALAQRPADPAVLEAARSS